MTPERWKRIEEIYHEALVCDASERTAFLATACGGDDAMRQDVESLLVQTDSAPGPLDGAAVDIAAQFVSQGGTTMVGQQLGVYQVVSSIGAGGMGEVYRARDTRLGREVAIKILPQAFTSDPDRLARFEREARVLASLNHPNIATIHGLEDAGSTRAIVMELVEGETLAARIARRAVPAGRRAVGRAADRGRARRRAREGDRPPRSQACQPRAAP